MQLPQIDYIQLFKDAWNITWKNKFLWWFGFFVAMGGAGGNLNYSFDPDTSSETEKEIFQKISGFASAHIEWIIAGAVILLVVIFALLVLGLIGKGALLKSIEKTTRGEKTNYRAGFLEGKKYWKRILLLDFLIFLFWLAIVIVLATPIIFLFVQKSFVFEGILLVMALFLLVPLIFLSIFLKNYGALYVVLGQLRAIPAIEKSYDLFLGNLSASAIFALFFIPLGIASTLVMIFLALPIVLVFLALGFALYFLVGKIGAMIVGGVGIFFLLVIVIFLRSVWEVFASASWVLFFQKIATPKIEERVAEEFKEIEKEILPEIEPVKTSGVRVEE